MTEITKYTKENSNKTIISFSGVSHGTGASVGEEFYNLTREYTGIFVKDLRQSWFNSVDVQKIIDTIDPTNSVYTIGNSMGAFNATMFAYYYPYYL